MGPGCCRPRGDEIPERHKQEEDEHEHGPPKNAHGENLVAAGKIVVDADELVPDRLMRQRIRGFLLFLGEVPATMQQFIQVVVVPAGQQRYHDIRGAGTDHGDQPHPLAIDGEALMMRHKKSIVWKPV